MELAGVPVGEARLPSLPLDDTSKSALASSFASFCNGQADFHYEAQLRMCNHRSR